MMQSAAVIKIHSPADFVSLVSYLDNLSTVHTAAATITITITTTTNADPSGRAV
jgi:hypothetical protein